MINAQEISIKDARDQMSELIETVAIAKRSFVITKFGKPKARIIPISKDVKRSKGGLEQAFGMWAYRKDIKDSAKWVSKMRDEWPKRYEESY